MFNAFQTRNAVPAGPRFELMFVLGFIVIVTALRIGFGNYAQWGADRCQAGRCFSRRFDCLGIFALPVDRQAPSRRLRGSISPAASTACLRVAGRDWRRRTRGRRCDRTKPEPHRRAFFSVRCCWAGNVGYPVFLEPRPDTQAARFRRSHSGIFGAGVLYGLFVSRDYRDALIWAHRSATFGCPALRFFADGRPVLLGAILYFEWPILAARPDYYDPSKVSRSLQYP